MDKATQLLEEIRNNLIAVIQIKSMDDSSLAELRAARDSVSVVLSFLGSLKLSDTIVNDNPEAPA